MIRYDTVWIAGAVCAAPVPFRLGRLDSSGVCYVPFGMVSECLEKSAMNVQCSAAGSTAV
jgi:hypothetical protein